MFFLFHHVMECMRLCTMGLKDEIDLFIFVCVSEYADRYSLTCVWCMFYSVKFPEDFRDLSCMLQPQVKEERM